MTKTNLSLSRPIAFIDLETTGVNIGSDRIVEISIFKLLSDGSEEVHTFRINPTIHIPAETSAIHGIFDKDVKDCPTFKELAPKLFQIIDPCDLAGYNSNKFDIPLLVEEFLRVELDFDMLNRKCIDVQNIFHKMEQRTLAAAYRFYCNKELENAHSAEADVKATFEVLMAQLQKYDTLQPNVSYLHTFSAMNDNVDLAGRIVRDKKGVEVFNFGKHKGKPVAEVFKNEPSYYNWMMDGDFALSTKRVITQLRLKAFNKQ
ncbi:MAG TPA: exonuclease domain-containing protein [Bacteroidia bacterium]|jgi:DNA polymerase-3 subunit epsilon|nr:exonuclease domain-containing protein [Bacteroidia bacterium]